MAKSMLDWICILQYVFWISFLKINFSNVCVFFFKDLLGKMFTFPQQTSTAHVRLTTSRQNLNAVTVCLR